eukprot:TRINITY_DN6760_c0_g1_i5.p1 TRINITY_DN6760_c0_g1~~TRINITY_DN6760_c0_g1_i5.p1  ORF type:complete len:188 (-),score=12.59 TRINITY_DN6760_c0_g1_i5:236-799(-)
MEKAGGSSLDVSRDTQHEMSKEILKVEETRCPVCQDFNLHREKRQCKSCSKLICLHCAWEPKCPYCKTFDALIEVPETLATHIKSLKIPCSVCGASIEGYRFKEHRVGESIGGSVQVFGDLDSPFIEELEKRGAAGISNQDLLKELADNFKLRLNVVSEPDLLSKAYAFIVLIRVQGRTFVITKRTV